LLGVAWIIEPLLGIFVDGKGQTSSKVGQGMQWIFVLLIGLEGVWVLIVNVLLYFSRKDKRKHQLQNSIGQKRKWFHSDGFGRISLITNGFHDKRNDEW
jgi:hypothetical protein